MQLTRFKFVVILLSLLVVALPLVSYAPIKSAEGSALEDAIRERDRLRQQLNSQKDTSNSIADQIAYTENQIRINELEIQDTQGQIQNTEGLIVETNSKIDEINDKLAKLNESINHTQAIADQRLRDAYKQSRVPEFSVLISADDFSGVMKTYAYLKAMEEEDERVLGIMSENRNNYLEQKKNLENLKLEKQNLVSQLESEKQKVAVQQVELDEAKAEKDRLLSDSKNSENYYSEMLARQEAQIRALSSAIVDPNLPKFWANRGDVIALQGNTGCSFGSHLHYGYRQVNWGTSGIGTISSGNWVDPKPFLDSGRLGKPLAGYNGLDAPAGNITQRFGENWNGMYDSNGHPAMDMSDYYGAPIFASESGWAVRMTDNGCGFGAGKGIMLTHADGSGQTLYWHIQ